MDGAAEKHCSHLPADTVHPCVFLLNQRKKKRKKDLPDGPVCALTCVGPETHWAVCAETMLKLILFKKLNMPARVLWGYILQFSYFLRASAVAVVKLCGGNSCVFLPCVWQVNTWLGKFSHYFAVFCIWNLPGTSTLLLYLHSVLNF